MGLTGSQPPLVPERHFVSMGFLPETGHGGRAAPQTMFARCSRVFHVSDDGRHSIPERHQAITGWSKCQPWFYLRLKAYSFLGLSEGAYGPR